MIKTLTVIYDGEALRPADPIDLKPNARYLVTVEQEVAVAEGENAWDILARLTGKVEGPEDWAAEHDHYLYRTPKRRDEASS
jgi:hypothetical protein